MYLATEAAVAAEPNLWWLNWIVALVVALLGAGGVASIIKARADKNAGIVQTETAEDDALAARWKNLIETQTKILLEPLQEKVAGLETEVRDLRHELSATNQKYWSAIGYIRQLLLWINRHMPDDIENTQIPQTPTRLTDDL